MSNDNSNKEEKENNYLPYSSIISLNEPMENKDNNYDILPLSSFAPESPTTPLNQSSSASIHPIITFHNDPYKNNNYDIVENSKKNSASLCEQCLLNEELEKTSLRNSTWNSRFQSALELSESDPVQLNMKYSKLSELSAEFQSTAITYGKLIISEHLLRGSSEKTLKTSSLKGFAGGTKYVIRGILFKLCIDPMVNTQQQYLYGYTTSNIEYANKAGGHELTGSKQYFQFQHSETKSSDISVRVPMQICLDYCGYRLIAMPILPIGSDSQVYGSSNGAISVITKNDQFTQWMKLAAEKLHLAPHDLLVKNCTIERQSSNQQVNINNHHRVTVYSAADIEGHFSSFDSRFYLLDLARSFPPEYPQLHPHMNYPMKSMFFQFLRPELLQLIKNRNLLPALSPDALTGFGILDSEIHHKHLKDATLIMINEYIPAFAEYLLHLPTLTIKSIGYKSGDPINITSVFSGAPRLVAYKQSKSPNPTNIKFSGTITETLQQQLASNSDPITPKSTNVDEFNHVRYSGAVHEFGINIRYTGQIRAYILAKLNESDTDIKYCKAAIPVVSAILLCEMISRTIKNMLRESLRKIIRAVCTHESMGFEGILNEHLLHNVNNQEFGNQNTRGFEYLAKQEIVIYLNYITQSVGSYNSKLEDCTQFWSLVTKNLLEKFGSHSLTTEEQQNLAEFAKPNLLRIIHYICSTVGISLHPVCIRQLNFQSVEHFAFSISDVLLVVRTKNMDYVDYIHGMHSQSQAELILNNHIHTNTNTNTNNHNKNNDSKTNYSKNELQSAIRLLEISKNCFYAARAANTFNELYIQQSKTCKTRLRELQALLKQYTVNTLTSPPSKPLLKNNTMLNIAKYEGCGNDFILIDANHNRHLVSLATQYSSFIPLLQLLSVHHNVFTQGKDINKDFLVHFSIPLADRRIGIGCDQIIILEIQKNSEHIVESSMFILNSDGSIAEMCGNALRAVGLYLHNNYGQNNKNNNLYSIVTMSGPLLTQILVDNIPNGYESPLIRCKLNIPQFLSIPGDTLTANNTVYEYYAVSVGNPHCVIFLPDNSTLSTLREFPLHIVGPIIENNLQLFANKINVEIVYVDYGHNKDNENNNNNNNNNINPSVIHIRIWERGAGLTNACGTGASAAAVCSILLQKVTQNKPVQVNMPGGALYIDWINDVTVQKFADKNNKGELLSQAPVYMTGPANHVFEAQYNLKI